MSFLFSKAQITANSVEVSFPPRFSLGEVTYHNDHNENGKENKSWKVWDWHNKIHRK
jgi:hypothetical protein